MTECANPGKAPPRIARWDRKREITRTIGFAASWEGKVGCERPNARLGCCSGIARQIFGESISRREVAQANNARLWAGVPRTRGGP